MKKFMKILMVSTMLMGSIVPLAEINSIEASQTQQIRSDKIGHKYKTFPKSMRGTWYATSNGETQKMKITAKTMIRYNWLGKGKHEVSKISVKQTYGKFGVTKADKCMVLAGYYATEGVWYVPATIKVKTKHGSKKVRALLSPYMGPATVYVHSKKTSKKAPHISSDKAFNIGKRANKHLLK
ncbi:hypothetical protein EQG49_01980 [Periweissella cryptocerci]|uniref:Uncharacterized protein n=1 Tax=Periweissella cryptocerci TaxID=2506420 RepID=A0A4P6YRN1_9LACO|nr:hypothetical protein [Periweissella cryptocerci]QBO35318.1 hypothetical protein EQG49_01980 [Periweissella cryptocerci]